MKKKKPSRQLTNGLYSIIISAVMIAAVVLINLIASALPASSMRIDTTKQGLFTVSDKTRSVTDALTEDVSLYLIAEPGKEDDYTETLLYRYAELTDRISVQHINPLTDPTFTARYTDETVEQNSIIAVCGERSLLVRQKELYSYGFDYDYYTNATLFDGESRLTGAIMYVTDPDIPAVYALSGHGEAELSDALKSAVTAENIELKTLELVTADSVPADAAAVIIAAPVSDISAREKELLTEYLDKGGRLLAYSSYTEADMTNFASLMETYGMRSVNGIIIEGDEAHSIAGYGYYLLPDIAEHDITAPLIENGLKVLTPTAAGIVETDHRGTVEVTRLLTTSDKSYAKTGGYDIATYDMEEGDIPGPLCVGAASVEKFGDTEIRILWFGSSMMLDDSVDEVVSGGNSELFINSLDWLTGSESGIAVRSKSIMTPYLSVTGSQKTLLTVIMLVLLPGAALAAGIAVWVYRRRRK